MEPLLEPKEGLGSIIIFKKLVLLRYDLYNKVHPKLDAFWQMYTVM